MDLRQLFDVMAEASSVHQIQQEIRAIERTNQQISVECGSCKEWMTSNCEREKHHKVTCSERICSKFSMDIFTKELIKMNEAKIADLNKTLEDRNNGK